MAKHRRGRQFYQIKNPFVNPDGSVRFWFVPTTTNLANIEAAEKWAECVTKDIVPVSTLHLTNLFDYDWPKAA